MMKIQTAIAANALFSGLSAVFIAWQGIWLATHIAMPQWLWTLMMWGLGAFSLQLAAMVVNAQLAKILIKSVILADALWLVIASIALMWFQGALSVLGIIIVLSVNAVVGALAVWQFLAWKQTSKILDVAEAT